jgi:hypothetical protein
MPARARPHRPTAVFAIGTALWAVAGAVLFTLQALDVDDAGDRLWVCAVGVVLGLAGIIYTGRSWRVGAAG